MAKSLKTDTYPNVKDTEAIESLIKDIHNTLKNHIEDLEKETGKELADLKKRIKSLEKKIEDIESTADGAESLAGDVELDLADLTVRVDSLEAKK